MRLDPDQWGEALRSMLAFAAQGDLGLRIAALEAELSGAAVEGIDAVQLRHNASNEALQGALTVKSLAGQVNVTIHALGIVAALPHILEPGEIVEDVSLGAGNTGRSFDLETDRWVAEFKFIRWRGGAESIRQNGVFIDLFRLAETKTERMKFLYLTGLEHPLRFLNGARNLNSVLSKNSAVHERFAIRLQLPPSESTRMHVWSLVVQLTKERCAGRFTKRTEQRLSCQRLLRILRPTNRPLASSTRLDSIRVGQTSPDRTSPGRRSSS